MSVFKSKRRETPCAGISKEERFQRWIDKTYLRNHKRLRTTMFFTAPSRCIDELKLPPASFIELRTDLTVWQNGKQIGAVSSFVRVKQAS